MEVSRVIGAVPLADCRLLICFDTGEVRLYGEADWAQILSPDQLSLLQGQPECFEQLELSANGREIGWPVGIHLPLHRLAGAGTALPLSRADFIAFCQAQLISTAEAAQMLRCTRQNIDSLVRRERLVPVKCYAKNKLFLKSDILRRMWEVV